MTLNWQDFLPELAASADSYTRDLYDRSRILQLPANTTVFMQGDACENYLLVLQGKVRVFTRAENGREIVLYRLTDGDSCILTTSCLFGQRRYPAEGITETDVTALAIPVQAFNEAMQASAGFRSQVFAAMTTHFTDLITLVEEVAFGKLDSRLSRFLLEQADSDQCLKLTHQEIATELGTAREVVSRQLKELELKGNIELGRGIIWIKSLQAGLD